MPKPTPHDADAQRLRQQLINFVSDPDYQPVKAAELLRQLRVPPAERRAAEDVINRLLREGELVVLKHKGLAPAKSADLVLGRISFTKSGAAFVNPVKAGDEVFVAAADTSTALPGDQVLVRISRHEGRDGKPSREGTVVRVLERRCLTVVGTLQQAKHVFYVSPMQSRIAHDIIVPDAGGANLGDRVLVRLEEWTDPRLAPEGQVVDVIGPADNPALDTLAVMKAYNLPEAFPAPVMREAERAAEQAERTAGRLDYRDHFVFTIDPKEARDFDDAISLEPAAGGNWKLGIHIADVSHFVAPDSQLDREARERATSVYLPDRVIPMLPVQLSNGICSLNPRADRLTLSVFAILTPAGDVRDYSFAETVIHSQLRLTYTQALAVLQSPAGAQFPAWKLGAPVVDLLKDAGRLAQQLRARRFRDGALRLDLPEVRFDIGKDGRIANVVTEGSDESHQLIEEFMVLANECVCRHLEEKGWPSIHRIHEEPDPERLAQLAQLFVDAGLPPADLTDRFQLAAMIERVEHMPQAHAWHVATLRSMKRARYANAAVGHYGLAKQYYTHFTSPIRRYPDLLVHRQLKALLHQERSGYTKDELGELAAHCSEREDIAAEAEREVTEQKTVRFFAEQLEAGQPREYEAVVTEVKNHGVMIDLPAVQVTGMIHVSHLSEDFFDFDPARRELRGRRTGIVYRVGSRLKVIITRVNRERRFLDFAPSEKPIQVHRTAAAAGGTPRPAPPRPATARPASGRRRDQRGRRDRRRR